MKRKVFSVFTVSLKEFQVLFLQTVGGDKDLMNFMSSQADFMSYARSVSVFDII